METYYRLGEIKSRGLREFNKIKDNKRKEQAREFKAALSPESLIESGITFSIKESDKMLLDEDNLKKLYGKIGAQFDVDISKITEKMLPIHLEKSTPLKFHSFEDFVAHQKGDEDSIGSFIRNRIKQEKAERKEKDKELKMKSSHAFNKHVMKSFKEDSVFVAIDFECLYSDNNVPVEVGVSKFKLNDAMEGHHFVFLNRSEELNTQPKKFRKTNHFAYGESETLKKEDIKTRLSQFMEEADYIVCHAAQLEKKMLRYLGVEFDNNKVIDSQLWYKSQRGEKQVKGLEKIAGEYGFDDVKFHNAGNDAAVTGLYFKELIRESRPELFNDEIGNKVVKKTLRRSP